MKNKIRAINRKVIVISTIGTLVLVATGWMFWEAGFYLGIGLFLAPVFLIVIMGASAEQDIRLLKEKEGK